MFLSRFLGSYLYLYIWEKNEDFSLYLGKITQNWEKKKAIFGLGMPPVTGGKSGQLKSLVGELERVRVLANHQQFMNHTNISYF